MENNERIVVEKPNKIIVIIIIVLTIGFIIGAVYINKDKKIKIEEQNNSVSSIENAKISDYESDIIEIDEENGNQIPKDDHSSSRKKLELSDFSTDNGVTYYEIENEIMSKIERYKSKKERLDLCIKGDKMFVNSYNKLQYQTPKNPKFTYDGESINYESCIEDIKGYINNVNSQKIKIDTFNMVSYEWGWELMYASNDSVYLLEYVEGDPDFIFQADNNKKIDHVSIIFFAGQECIGHDYKLVKFFEDDDYYFFNKYDNEIIPFKTGYRNESVIIRMNTCASIDHIGDYSELGVNLDRELLIKPENGRVFTDPKTGKPIKVNRVIRGYSYWLVLTDEGNLFLFSSNEYIDCGPVKTVDYTLNDRSNEVSSLKIELENGQTIEYEEEIYDYE